MFSVGEKIVHPLHGAGYIDGIVSRSVSGEYVDYYVMKISNGKIVVMIPVATSESVGLRPVVTPQVARQVIECFSVDTGVSDATWNKRYRDNMLRLKSGDLFQVADVVKGLIVRDRKKGLSTGERKMYHNAKQILYSELVMVLGKTERELEQEIIAAMGK